MPTTTLSLRAATAAIVLTLVAACGGGSDSDDPTPAKTSAAPATPSATAVAPGERPKDDKSDGSAIAFSEFVVKRIVGVTTGEDVDTVLTLASADCQGCINLAQGIKKQGTVRQQLDAAPEIRDAAVVDTSDDGTQYVVEQTLVSPAGREVDTATGKVVESFEESLFTFRVVMAWTDGKWVLTNYSAKQKQP